MQCSLRRSMMLVLFCLPGMAIAQCDTAAVAAEVRKMEELTWSDYPKAVRWAYALVKKYEGSTGPCSGLALLGLAKAQWTNGDYDSSVTTLNAGLKVARRIRDKETEARMHHVMANNYYYQGYYDSAKVNFEKTLRLFQELNHRTGEIEVLHDMALMYHRRGDFAKSLRHLLELESLKEAQPDFVHFVGDFTGINNYFIDTLYYRGVVEAERRLYEKFKSERNSYGAQQSLINLAIAYREMGDHRKSAYMAARGSELMSADGYYPFWYLAAEEYGLAGMEDSCFHFHRLALKELPKATRIKVVITYEHIAQSHLTFHRPDSALQYLEMTFALNKAMNNRLAVAAMHCDLAEVYDMLHQPERAEQHLLEGVSLARQVSVKHTASLYAFGRDFYTKRNQPALALMYSRLSQKLADSINRDENAMGLLRFQAQLETSQKARELEATRLKLRNRTIILVSVIVVTLLSIAFVCLLYLQRQRIKQQNARLSQHNVEQQAMLQEIHHRVKNNLQYIVSLLNLQANSVNSQELASHIEEIKNRIMTMGLIHQRLYQSQGIQRIDVAVFVAELVTNLLNVLPSQRPVTRQLHLESFLVDIDTAISIGLLINEFITNAVKHAFQGHSDPELFISIVREGKGLTMVLGDNGPGFHFPGNGRGFGLKLIALLVRKLKGRIIQPNQNSIEIKTDVSDLKSVEHAQEV